MSEYPTLNKMGINNPGDIERYSHQTIGHTDILRVVYKRKKGSLLASSRRYRFERGDELVLAGGDSRGAQVRSNISPDLRSALSELNTVTNKRANPMPVKELIRDEVRRLREENEARLAHIESLLQQLD